MPGAVQITAQLATGGESTPTVQYWVGVDDPGAGVPSMVLTGRHIVGLTEDLDGIQRGCGIEIGDDVYHAGDPIDDGHGITMIPLYR